jgi:arginyl-tRNA synthetase
MSSRKGDVVKIVDLIEQVKNEILNKFGDRIDNLTAQKLAISSIIINDLKNDMIKDINFDISKMTKLEGDT